uniref:Auxin-induced in root cultures protein 12 n=1 Tax=Rhizophora mucronata TaxID=61149 RepID=A0A2P2PPY6_RHIMU
MIISLFVYSALTFETPKLMLLGCIDGLRLSTLVV